MLTRREVNVGILAGAALAAAPGGAVAQAPTVLKLPPPRNAGGMPLFAALALRRSTRAYSERPLSQQALSDLLWAAYGVNRPDGGRTAPYWRHLMVIDLYVATADGVWLYDPAAHALLPHMGDDIRAATGQQDFVGHAALDLVYVAHGERMSDVSPAGPRPLRLGRLRFHRPERLSLLRFGGLGDGLSRVGRQVQAR